ncbi:MAG: ABC transporter permease, partial [Saonia sp.]
MFTNYLKIAWRNLIKHKGYSLLNISGLAVGIAAVILVFVYVQDETGYDTIHPQHELVFGIGEEFTTDEGEKFKLPSAPSGWANLLKEQVPGVVETLRVFGPGYPHSIRNPEDNKTILTQDSEIFLVDGSYGKVLHFPLLYGNEEQVLSEPNSIVLSEKVAERLFGSIDVVGRTLEIKNLFIAKEYANLKGTGVMKNYPNNSHIRPDYLLS